MVETQESPDFGAFFVRGEGLEPPSRRGVSKENRWITGFLALHVPSDASKFQPEEPAERLGIPLRMVREMYYTNAWPHLRLNERTVRFTESHYEQIIAMGERRPTTEIRTTSSAQKAAELAGLLGRKKPA